ncbi:aspartyl-tRNA(Asn)/glutamyl-tRNA(Gln) amidotransferase subunit A [Nocardia tenerifensis]|uniref:Aspartyl-tRNA(Asn)/glutamyl-tRNA(Gln) amidotransferase subunit A n=1 Tax=Nocardia tenerifensis TaxID=228006 RepID=A0A318JU58_9NOCA|nr:amidase [Nocardia tenerifensis]PXX57625.1 aspartyl-tRNA(Asn)/glutamyl-tRNA(Gln) amidotransferase subunit A [Nocardia tenerifensis]
MPIEPYSITAAARALRAGETTSVALIETAIARADRYDSELGVYLARFDESARRQAQRADEELARGVDRGVLHGIPIAVKDTVAVADGDTTAQSLVHDREWAAGRDAPVVARLREAGAIITGKTTTMEFACGVPSSSEPFPLPRNPWDPSRWAGGSSSGTAGGVAAGLFPAGLGSDTAGSIRMPAAFCGVTGLMPTFGHVPKSGCVPLGYSLDRVGPLARTAADCAALLAVIAGPHASDPDSTVAQVDHRQVSELDSGAADLTGLRVGVARHAHFPVDADPALLGVFDCALGVLTACGAQAEEVTLPYWNETIVATIVTATCEALAYHRTTLSQRWNDYFVASRGLLAKGALVSGADYVQAQRVRRVAQAAIGELFERFDVVVCPTASVGAPRFDELLDEAGFQDDARLFGKVYTPYWNGLGTPVLALPMGFGATGLPLSWQIAGPAFGETTILRVGDVFQRHTEWHRQLPPLDRTAVAL